MSSITLTLSRWSEKRNRPIIRTNHTLSTGAKICFSMEALYAFRRISRNTSDKTSINLMRSWGPDLWKCSEQLVLESCDYLHVGLHASAASWYQQKCLDCLKWNNHGRKSGDIKFSPNNLELIVPVKLTFGCNTLEIRERVSMIEEHWHGVRAAWSLAAFFKRLSNSKHFLFICCPEHRCGRKVACKGAALFYAFNVVWLFVSLISFTVWKLQYKSAYSSQCKYMSNARTFRVQSLSSSKTSAAIHEMYQWASCCNK